jgi:DNA polymerase-3 subunit epsilon
VTFSRPCLFIDIESTGVDPVVDRIVEFAAIRVVEGAVPKSFSCRFNPGVHIPEEATKVHGIRDEDVAQSPKFEAFVPRIEKAMVGCDIAGYNLRMLDLPILDAEFRRAGTRLNLDGVNIIDVFGIFRRKESRDLASAVKFYTGEEHKAHSALGDAHATMIVLQAQAKRYEDLGALSMEELATWSSMRDDGSRPADLGGKLYWDAGGVLRYNIGKARGTAVCDDVGFANWMLCRDFPEDTKDLLRKTLQPQV